jgi:hypothetical protein
MIRIGNRLVSPEFLADFIQELQMQSRVEFAELSDADDTKSFRRGQ